MEIPPPENIGWNFRPQTSTLRTGFATVASIDAEQSLEFMGPEGQYANEHYLLNNFPSNECGFACSQPCLQPGSDVVAITDAVQPACVPDGSQLISLNMPPSADFERLQRMVSELREALDLWQRRASGAQQQADSTASHLAGLQRENWELGAEVVRLRQELALLGGNLRGQLSMVQGAVVSELQSELSELQAQVGALQEEVGVLVEQLQAAERDAAAAAAAAAAERERLAGELGAARVLAAARGRAAEGLQSQLDQVRQMANAEAEALRSDLAEATARAEAAAVAASCAESATERHRGAAEELRRQLVSEVEARERLAAELELVRCDARDLRVANEYLEASLEAHFGSGSGSSSGGAALLQLHAELRRLQSESMAERQSLQAALARAQSDSRTAAHQLEYLRQLQDLSGSGPWARPSPPPSSSPQPAEPQGPPSVLPPPAAKATSCSSSQHDPPPCTSASSCCEWCGFSSSSCSGGDDDGSSIVGQKQHQKDVRWLARRVRELTCSLHSLQEELVSERDRADGLERLVSELQQQLQVAMDGNCCSGGDADDFSVGDCSRGTTKMDDGRASTPSAGRCAHWCGDPLVQPQQHQDLQQHYHNLHPVLHPQQHQPDSPSDQGRLFASHGFGEGEAPAAACVPSSAAKSLAHSLFSSNDDDDDEDEEGYYGNQTLYGDGGTTSGVGTNDTGCIWMDGGSSFAAATSAASTIAPTCARPTMQYLITTSEAAVQTDEHLSPQLPGSGGGGGGSADTAAPAVTSVGMTVQSAAAASVATQQTSMLLAAARDEIERLKEINAKLVAAQDRRRYVVMDDVRAALAEARETAARQAEQALAAQKAAANSRYEALAAVHAALEEEVQNLRHQLKGATKDAKVALEEQVSELQRQLGEAGEQLDAARARAERLGEQLEQVRAAAEADAAAMLEKARADSAAAAQRQLDALRTSLVDEHSAALEALRAQLEATHGLAISKARAQHEAQREELRQRHVEEVATLRERLEAIHESTSAEEAARHASQVNELRRRHDAEIAELRDVNRGSDAAEAAAAQQQQQNKLTEGLSRLSEDYSQQLAELQSQHVEEIEALYDQHASEMEALCQQHAAEVEGLRREHGAEAAALRRQLHEAVEVAARRLAEMEKQAGAEAEAARQQLAAALEAARVEAEAARRQLEQELRGQHAEEQQEMQSELNQLRTTICLLEEQLMQQQQQQSAKARQGQQREEASQQEQQQQLAVLAAQLSRQQAELKQQATQLELLRERHEQELSAVRATHGFALTDAAAQHSADMRDLKRQHEQELGGLRRQLEATHASAAAELVARHEVAVEVLRRQHMEEVVELQRRMDSTHESVARLAESRHVTQLEDLKRRHEHEMAALRQRMEATHGSALVQAEKRHVAQLEELAQRREEELAAIQKEHAAALETAAAAHAEQAAALDRQYDMFYKDRLAETAKSLRDAHQGELRRVATAMGTEAAAAAVALRERMQAHVIQEVAAAMGMMKREHQQHQARGADSKGVAAAAPFSDRTNGQAAGCVANIGMAPQAVPSSRGRSSEQLLQSESSEAPAVKKLAGGSVAERQSYIDSHDRNDGGGDGGRIPDSTRGWDRGTGVGAVLSDTLHLSHGSNSSGSGIGSTRSGSSTRSVHEVDGTLPRPPAPELCTSPKLHPDVAAIKGSAAGAVRPPPHAIAATAARGQASDCPPRPSLPNHCTPSGSGAALATATTAIPASSGGADVLESLLGRALLSSRIHRDRSLAQEAIAAKHATLAVHHEARLQSLCTGRRTTSSASVTVASDATAVLCAEASPPPARPAFDTSSRSALAAVRSGSDGDDVITMVAGAAAASGLEAQVAMPVRRRHDVWLPVANTTAPPPQGSIPLPYTCAHSPSVSSRREPSGRIGGGGNGGGGGGSGTEGGRRASAAMRISLSDLSAVAAAAAAVGCSSSGGGGSATVRSSSITARSSSGVATTTFRSVAEHRSSASGPAPSVAASAAAVAVSNHTTRRRASQPGGPYVRSSNNGGGGATDGNGLQRPSFISGGNAATFPADKLSGRAASAAGAPAANGRAGDIGSGALMTMSLSQLAQHRTSLPGGC